MKFLSLNDKPASDYWSMQLIKDLASDLDTSNRELVVVPGEYQDPKAINAELLKYEKVLLVLASDEENAFDLNAIKHPDIIIYSMYPTDKYKNVDYWLPLGYTPHIRPLLKELGLPIKAINWFFSGQITHESRTKLAEVLSKLPNGVLNKTDGFTKGLTKDDYTKQMWQALVVPSAGGPATAEAFRTYEALEAGAIPIPENLHHHEKIMTNIPFIVLDKWDNVNDYITNYSQRYPLYHNQVFAWWQMQKRLIRERFKKDLGIEDEITVIVPTSPVKSNPETAILIETVNSIRQQLPNAEIIITFDGVRREQIKMNTNYQEYIRRILWLCNFEWKDVTPIVFDEHTHQVGMMRKALEYVNTPYVVYVEHDTPFNDRAIEWTQIVNSLKFSAIDLVRFHFEETIPEPHYHMMLDTQAQFIHGVPLIRTVQWSQRPHIASKVFYDRILRDCFTPQAKSMIEDKMHGVVWNAYDTKGKAGWNNYRLAIYAPEGGFARSMHTDGRQGAEKYDETQVF